MPTSLQLTLHRQWFNDILSGQKTIEYREIKPHWTKRIAGRQYDEIHFRNGYQPQSPWMRVQYRGYFMCNNLFCLRLGKILETKYLHN